MVPVMLHESIIQNLRGRRVYMVTKDGRQYVGLLQSCHKGKIILFTHTHSHHKMAATQKSKCKTQKQKYPVSAGQSTTIDPYNSVPSCRWRSFSPHGYTKRVELQLTAVSLLFLLFI